MELGDRFTFNTIAKKRRVWVKRGVAPPVKPESILSDWGGNTHDCWAMWTRSELRGAVTGMYIGWRTIFDGKVTYEGEEIGNVFTQRRKHRVLLFVVDEHTNPIRVFPEDAHPVAITE